MERKKKKIRAGWEVSTQERFANNLSFLIHPNHPPLSPGSTCRGAPGPQLGGSAPASGLHQGVPGLPDPRAGPGHSAPQRGTSRSRLLPCGRGRRVYTRAAGPAGHPPPCTERAHPCHELRAGSACSAEHRRRCSPPAAAVHSSLCHSYAKCGHYATSVGSNRTEQTRRASGIQNPRQHSFPRGGGSGGATGLASSKGRERPNPGSDWLLRAPAGWRCGLSDWRRHLSV